MNSLTAISCLYCDAALDALARRRGLGICGAAECRHRSDRAHTARLKQALHETACDEAVAQLPQRSARPRTVVWLEHCEPRIVASSDDERSQHRAYLERVVAENLVIDRSRLAPSTADDTHPQGARLCGQCRGRCCGHGGEWRAFLDVTVLERWRVEAPDRSLGDAIEAYMVMLPAEHVDGACLYQTTAGCAMPRERRAEICNGYACAALHAVQDAAAADSSAAAVAITFHKDSVERAAVIEPGATHAIELKAPVLQR